MADRRETLDRVVAFLQKCVEGKRNAGIDVIQKFVDYVVECRESNMISLSQYKDLKKSVMKKFGLAGVSFHDAHLNLHVFRNPFQNRKMRTAVATIALVGSLVGRVGDFSKAEDTKSTTYTEAADTKRSVSEDKIINDILKEVDIVKLYDEETIKPITAYLSAALPNGIYSASEKEVIARQGLHNFWIANIKQLNDNDKLAFASSTNQVSLQEWFNLSSQIADDMVDVKPDTIPFDANDLFKRDPESAKLVNQVIDIFARWNANKNNQKIADEWKQFCLDIHENIDNYISKNPAAVEVILNIISQGQTPGTDLQSGIDQFKLFDGTTSDLNKARVALSNLLHVDFALVKDDNKEVYKDILNTDALQKTGFANLNDANTALQIKFAANVEELSLKQIQSFSSRLQMNGTRNAWGAFSDEVAVSIAEGNFDNSVIEALFSNKEDVKNLKDLNSIVKGYQNAKSNEEKAKYYDDYNTFAYKFATQLEERTNKNDAASDLILNTISKIKQKNVGLHLDREDVLEGNLQNGTKGLYKILVGDGLVPDCNITDTYLDENGNIVANRTFWQENRAELMYRIGCIEITKQAFKNVDAHESIAESIILQYKDKVSKEPNNRSEVIIRTIANRIKDVEFVANMNREDYYTSLYDWSANYGSGGASGNHSNDVTIPADEPTKYSGKGHEDNGLPIWTEEKIKKTEEEAKEEINADYGYGEAGVTDIHFEETEPEVVDEETTVEWVTPSEEEKKENEEAIKEGDITADDVADDSVFDNDGTEFDVGDVDDLTEEGINEILKLQQKLDNGEISVADYNAAVKHVYEQYGKKNQDQNNNDSQNKPTESPDDKKDNNTPEKDKDNTNSKPEEKPSIPENNKTLEQLLADGTISQEEYDMIKNNQIPVEGEQNHEIAPAGTTMVRDGITFIADGSGNWIQQDTNAKDEDLSSSFEQASKEEQDANTTDIEYEVHEEEKTSRSVEVDNAAEEQARKEAEAAAQRAAEEQARKEAEAAAQRAAEEQARKESEERQQKIQELHEFREQLQQPQQEEVNEYKIL